MNKKYFDYIDNDRDDIDSEFNDMIKSLSFRNRPDRKSFRILDEELQTRRKRNQHRPRKQDMEVF